MFFMVPATVTRVGESSNSVWGCPGLRAAVIIANTCKAGRNGLCHPFRVLCSCFSSMHCCFWLYSCSKYRKLPCGISKWFNFRASECHIVACSKNGKSLLSRSQWLDITSSRRYAAPSQSWAVASGNKAIVRNEGSFVIRSNGFMQGLQAVESLH